MLFWIFVAIFLAGVILWSRMAWNVLIDFLFVIGIFALTASAVAFGVSYLGVDGEVAEKEARYETLVYQYVNGIYDNDDTDVGKRELLEDIQKWNEDIARLKVLQKDFWVGIFIPNVYDQFELILLDE